MNEQHPERHIFTAQFDEVEWLWRISQTHDLAYLRAIMRRRLEQLCENSPNLSVRMEVLRADVRGWDDYT